MKRFGLIFTTLMLLITVATAQLCWSGGKPEAPPGMDQPYIIDQAVLSYTPTFNPVEFYQPEQATFVYYAPLVLVNINTPVSYTDLGVRWDTPMIEINNELNIVTFSDNDYPIITEPLQTGLVSGTSCGGIGY